MSLAPFLIGAVAIGMVALVAGWYGGAEAAPSSPNARQPADPTSGAVPVATTSAVREPIATDEGLTLTVAFGRAEVEPGGSLAIDLAIRNGRSEPVILAVDHCGAPATMYAMAPVPFDPVGRDWDGIAGAFKTYALIEGNGPGGVPATAPGRAYATAKPCDERGSEITLAPSESTNASLVWTAELVKDLPALPGEVAFNVSVGHDPTGEPPSYPPDYKGPSGGWVKTYEQLTVEGLIQVVGDAPKVVTAGQALDAMLADERFAAWLSQEPRSTWSTANVFLLNYGSAQGIVPAGPAWEIDLFREIGVPRNWAIGFVDPFTGELLGLTFCNIPCDR